MKYEMSIGAPSSEPQSVVVENNNGTYTVNGTPKAVDVADLGSSVYSLIVDGRSHEVSVKKLKSVILVEVDGYAIPVKIMDPAALVKESATASSEAASPAKQTKKNTHDDNAICAPMTARVVSLKVDVGSSVSKGAGVIVVEAMKMEHELTSPKAGKIKSILVKPGDSIEEGQDLVVIE